jgi:hypothetical protein
MADTERKVQTVDSMRSAHCGRQEYGIPERYMPFCASIALVNQMNLNCDLNFLI